MHARCRTRRGGHLGAPFAPRSSAHGCGDARGELAIRFLYFLFLLAFAGAVGAFAYFNQEQVSLKYFQWSGTYSLAAVAGAAYLLGMFSGWSVVGMLRRSFSRVTEST